VAKNRMKKKKVSRSVGKNRKSIYQKKSIGNLDRIQQKYFTSESAFIRYLDWARRRFEHSRRMRWEDESILWFAPLESLNFGNRSISEISDWELEGFRVPAEIIESFYAAPKNSRKKETGISDITKLERKVVSVLESIENPVTRWGLFSVVYAALPPWDLSSLSTDPRMLSVTQRERQIASDEVAARRNRARIGWETGEDVSDEAWREKAARSLSARNVFIHEFTFEGVDFENIDDDEVTIYRSFRLGPNEKVRKGQKFDPDRPEDFDGWKSGKGWSFSTKKCIALQMDPFPNARIFTKQKKGSVAKPIATYQQIVTQLGQTGSIYSDTNQVQGTRIVAAFTVPKEKILLNITHRLEHEVIVNPEDVKLVDYRMLDIYDWYIGTYWNARCVFNHALRADLVNEFFPVVGDMDLAFHHAHWTKTDNADALYDVIYYELKTWAKKNPADWRATVKSIVNWDYELPDTPKNKKIFNQIPKFWFHLEHRFEPSIYKEGSKRGSWTRIKWRDLSGNYNLENHLDYPFNPRGVRQTIQYLRA